LVLFGGVPLLAPLNPLTGLFVVILVCGEGDGAFCNLFIFAGKGLEPFPEFVCRQDPILVVCFHPGACLDDIQVLCRDHPVLFHRARVVEERLHNCKHGGNETDYTDHHAKGADI